MKTYLNLTAIVRGPFDLVEIEFEVDGASGRTTCEAWRGQHEIEAMERAGYQITGVKRAEQ